MKLKSKIMLLIIGTLLAMSGINLISHSETTKKIGVILALSGVLTDIVILLILMKNEKSLREN